MGMFLEAAEARVLSAHGSIAERATNERRVRDMRKMVLRQRLNFIRDWVPMLALSEAEGSRQFCKTWGFSALILFAAALAPSFHLQSSGCRSAQQGASGQA